MTLYDPRNEDGIRDDSLITRGTDYQKRAVYMAEQKAWMRLAVERGAYASWDDAFAGGRIHPQEWDTVPDMAEWWNEYIGPTVYGAYPNLEHMAFNVTRSRDTSNTRTILTARDVDGAAWKVYVARMAISVAGGHLYRWLVYHETAHALASIDNDEAVGYRCWASHGREFVGTHLALVEHFEGTEARMILVDEFRKSRQVHRRSVSVDGERYNVVLARLNEAAA